MTVPGIKRLIRRKIGNVVSGGRFPLLHSMEPVYQNLVLRDLTKMGIEDDFYPVAGAATYSLFYLLIRLAKEFPIKNILELGAGETTRLFDALTRCGVLSASVFTLEHDRDWAIRVERRVQHEIVGTSLIQCSIDGVSFLGYNFSAVNLPKNVELLVVDGPPASTEENAFSRLGAVDLVETLNAEAFVVILDDTHRAGEMLLIEKMEVALHRRGLKFSKGQIITSKRQTIFASGRYEGAAFF